MRDPLAWCGGAVVAGAVLWPATGAAPGPLGAALLVCAALGFWGRSALPWVLASALLGALACAALDPPPPLLSPRAVRAEVLRVSAGVALLEAPDGRYLAAFAGDPPGVGDRIAALLGPLTRDPPLPGEPDPEVGARRAGAVWAEVQRWVRLGAPRPARVPLDGVPHAGLLEALVSGRKDGLPEDQLALLRRTGTAHLLSVSGMNVALVAGAVGAVVSLLCRPLSLLPWPAMARLPPLLLGLVAAHQYAALAGWPVSTRRALWMVAAALVARALGRRARPWSLLGMAAIAVVLPDPGQVSELGFQLSFGAVAGMLWVAPRLTRLLPPDTPAPARWLVGALGATLGATAGTLPVTCWRFQELSPASPLANLLAGPLLGGLAGSGAMLAALLPGEASAICLRVADLAAGLCLAGLRHLDVERWHPAVGPAGALLLAAAVPLRRHPALAAGLGTIALLLRRWPTVPTAVFLSVGQGDATALRWPDGRVWLIDGGPPGGRVLAWLRRERLTRLEAVFLSHPDADHLGGLLPVVEQLDVRALVVPALARPDQPLFASLLATAGDRGVPVLLPGDPMPEGATLLHPTPGWREAHPDAADNDDGLVLRVDLAGYQALFPGDIEAEAEAWLAPSLGPVHLLKAPHHGSRTSSTPALVSVVRPRLVVVPVGAGNPYGHPHAEVLARWSEAQVYRTDLDGTIEVAYARDGPVVKLRH